MSAAAKMTPTPDPLAYSYVRFSTPDQAKGDSLRRQTDAAREWAERKGVRLDNSLTLHDLGKSAFKGKHRENPDRNALASFLAAVNSGKVPRGSFLIIESLDRLTREHIRPALTLLLNLIEDGVRVVQLKPVEVVYDEDVEPMTLMMALMELSRGNSESKVKSQRVGAAWAQKRVEMRRNGKVLTDRLPAWIRRVGDSLQVIPERADVVRRIFALTADGYGRAAVVKLLTREKVPTFGTILTDEQIAHYCQQRSDKQQPLTPAELSDLRKPGHWNHPRDGSLPVWVVATWNRNYIGLMLTDKRVLGQLQPKLRDGTADGAPLDYYPSVITPAEWHKARAACDKRRNAPRVTRTGKHVDLFSGLLFDPIGGGSFYSTTRSERLADGTNKQTRVIMNVKGAEGNADLVSFPLATFEAAVLSALAEIDPAEANPDTAPTPDDVAVLAAKQEQIRQHIADLTAELTAELAKGSAGSPVVRSALSDAIRQVEQESAELAAALEGAEQEAAAPIEDAKVDLQQTAARITRRENPYPPRLAQGCLLPALANAPPEEVDRVRRHLRALLARTIDKIRVVALPHGRDRMAYAEVYIKGDSRVRQIEMMHQPPKSNGKARTPGKWFMDTSRGSGTLSTREGAENARKMLLLYREQCLADRPDNPNGIIE